MKRCVLTLYAVLAMGVVPAFALQISDGQSSGTYNGRDMAAAQRTFSGIRAREGGVPVGTVITWVQKSDPTIRGSNATAGQSIP